MKIFVIGVLPSSLINFRGGLIKEMALRSDKVFALSNSATREEIEGIEALGCRTLNYNVARNGLNPLSDLRTFLDLSKAIRSESPEKILSYTIKPVIWSGLAARGTNTSHYAMITGLGFAFQPGGLLKNLLIRLMLFQSVTEQQVFFAL